MARYFKAAPFVVDGKRIGMVLFNIPPGSEYAAMGLCSGDVITLVDGRAFDDPALSSRLAALSESGQPFVVELLRRRKPYSIVVSYGAKTHQGE
jgi:S1-C subfamily serine protease